jgi:SAM-dependent methyltransferase
MPNDLFDVPAVPSRPLWRGADVRLYAAALRLRSELPWLESVFPDPDTEASYFWTMNFGLRTRPEWFTPLLPEIPDSERLSAVSGSDNLEMFLNAGANSAEEVLKTARQAGIDPFGRRRILDFGCGCARVLRHLLPLSNRSELWGCDIDQDAIDYCRTSIGGARFIANRADPPLPFADASFDLIFSISIFTHLARTLHDAWVREFRRVVSAEGLVVVSLHGQRAWEKVRENASFRRDLQIRTDEFEAAELDWNREGFALVTSVVPAAYEHAEPYGMVFVRPDVVASLWPGFELVRYDAGVLADWQDLAALRPI